MVATSGPSRDAVDRRAPVPAVDPDANPGPALHADPPTKRGIRGWTLWSVRPVARGFILGVDLLAVVLTGLLLIAEPVSSTQLGRVGVVAILAIGYAETVYWVPKLKTFFGGSAVCADQLTVWTFAAALLAPAGWAALLVAIMYAHVVLQLQRSGNPHLHRAVFTGASVMLAVVTTSLVLTVIVDGPPERALAEGIRASAAVLAGLVLYTVVSFVVVTTGMALHNGMTRRSIAVPTDVLVYELATLVLATGVATTVLYAPLLTPLTLVLAVFLHRSSLVNALHKANLTDPKTGLLTLPAWTEHATGVLARTRRSVSVLFCDLDHFKVINDTRGHLYGDDVIRAVADCLQREVRDPAVVGRFGGEEFVVLLTDLDADLADRIAHRLLAAVADLQLPDNGRVTVSIGLTNFITSVEMSGNVPEVLQRLLAQADIALQNAKENGRNQVCTVNMSG